jgi:hypothetical protein
MSSITATRAFRLAVGVVALHVLDDNFVQPHVAVGSRSATRGLGAGRPGR